MRRAIVRILATIGGVYLVSLLLLGIIVWKRGRKEKIPDRAILHLSVEKAPVEEAPDDLLAGLLGSHPVAFRDLLEALERAEGDARVAGVMLDGNPDLGLAQAQELRDAILRLRSKGKFAIAFADTFGEFGPGMKEYYLATAFEEIWLQPSGDIGLTGVSAEVPFIRGTLEKIGILPHIGQRKEYKNAANSFTEKKFTPAHKEATERIVQSAFGQMAKGIAQARHLDEAMVRQAVDRGPFSAQDALASKLVDHVGYRDEAVEVAKRKAGANAVLLPIETYLERAGRPHTKGKTVALIYGVGNIQRGASDHQPFSSPMMGAETVAAAFRQAVKDPSVKAILFRVDSPGGSYVASDSIWRETVRAKQAGKPVVVSMGNVAGSGGYFVAMSADRIVAEPGTLTGSIGVFGGKAVLKELWEKIGLSWEEVHQGANASMWSLNKDYTAGEWARIDAWLDRVYADFTTKVAQGRKLTKERVLEVAKGRVWTGEDAKAKGLVDELGGMATALGLAKQVAGIPAGEGVTLAVYPKRKSPLERLLARLLGKDEEAREEKASTGVESLVRLVTPLLGELRALSTERSLLRMAPHLAHGL